MELRRFPLSIGIAIGLILSIVFAGGFLVGALAQRATGASGPQTSDSNLREFLYAYDLVTQRSYFRPFDRQHLVYAAIDGMLSATGDPHTLFLSPNENQVANKQLNGSQFSGIGAIVMSDHGHLDVWAPLPHSPAAAAGLKPDDVVTKIDGRPVSSMRGDDAIARIHGRTGSYVHLLVTRGHRRAFYVAVKRARIAPITAYGRLIPHHLGYLQIMTFGESTGHEVSSTLRYLVKHGAKGLVLDLRGNPGGYVDAAQQVTSQFLSHGVVAYERGTNKQLNPLSVLAGHQVTNDPVAILVDENTASAAEITASALRDNGHAILVGSRTYGKGSMQSVYALADGSSIRITDRLWLTPRKRSIQRVGLTPNIAVVPADSLTLGKNDRSLRVAERYLIRRLRR